MAFSPLLFALAVEQLAIAIRLCFGIKGFLRETGKERIALYAEDFLLFLVDTEQSLRQVMNIVEGFGRLGISHKLGEVGTYTGGSC